MIRKTDLQDVIEEMNEEDRQRLGDPPTFDEMLAYTRGELSAEEEQRVRELLICYPELARTLTEPFEPEETATLAPVLRFRHVWTALAAALALVFAGLYWQADTKARRLDRQLSLPHVVANEQLLLPDGQRGREHATTLTVTGDSYLLIAALIHEARYPQYRLEIVDAGAKPLWRQAGLQPRDNDTFAVLVPRAFLPPGEYQVVLYGLGGPRAVHIATYTVRVPKG
jgi:hypothetical protein